MGQQSPSMTARISRWRRRFGGLAVGIVTLLAYVCASFPVLPSAQWLYRASPWHERFPCEDHACGCMSAEECWNHCCCMTPEQRLAWAEANHVQPPPSARGMLRAAALARAEHALSGGCPLCRAAAAARQANEQPKPTAPGRPFLSPLGCKGFAGWLMATPPRPIVSQGLSMAPPRVVAVLASQDPRDPPSRSIEPSAPPPRGV
jgi:hypothetical protein